MILLNSLPKTTKTAKKRRGMGLGSGKGKTASRGTKGQKAKRRIPRTISILGPALIKRLPLYRGKSRNKPIANKPYIINLKYLNILPQNSIVDRELLLKYHILAKENYQPRKIKILGMGEINIPLIINLPISKNAIKKIVKAGGKVKNQGGNSKETKNIEK